MGPHEHELVDGREVPDVDSFCPVFSEATPDNGEVV